MVRKRIGIDNVHESVRILDSFPDASKVSLRTRHRWEDGYATVASSASCAGPVRPSREPTPSEATAPCSSVAATAGAPGRAARPGVLRCIRPAVGVVPAAASASG